MRILVLLLAGCSILQAATAARLGRTSSRSLQSNDLPWNGPKYDIKRNGLDESETINTAELTMFASHWN